MTLTKNVLRKLASFILDKKIMWKTAKFSQRGIPVGNCNIL